MSVVWRDRTNLYLSYRQSYVDRTTRWIEYTKSHGSGASLTDNFSPAPRKKHDGTQALLSAGASDHHGDAVIDFDLVAPVWSDVTDEIKELLDDIASHSQALERLHQMHVLPGFNDEVIKRNEAKEIENLTQKITRGFHEAHRSIYRLERLIRHSKEADSLSTGGETIAKNMQTYLASRVQDASASFRRKQSAYLKSTNMSNVNDLVEIRY